jgi:hypothetical protein
MADSSVSLFVLTALFLVVMGAIFAAVGFGYSRGYFTKRVNAPVFCVFCGAKLNGRKQTCGRCGATGWMITQFR